MPGHFVLVDLVIGLGRLGVVNGGIMESLQVWAFGVDVFVKTFWLGKFNVLVQVIPSWRVLEGFVRALEVQAQVKRLALLAVAQPF